LANINTQLGGVDGVIPPGAEMTNTSLELHWCDILS